MVFMVSCLTARRYYLIVEPRVCTWYLGDRAYRQWQFKHHRGLPDPPPVDYRGNDIPYSVTLYHIFEHYLVASHWITDIRDNHECYRGWCAQVGLDRVLLVQAYHVAAADYITAGVVRPSVTYSSQPPDVQDDSQPSTTSLSNHMYLRRPKRSFRNLHRPERSFRHLHVLGSEFVPTVASLPVP